MLMILMGILSAVALFFGVLNGLPKIFNHIEVRRHRDHLRTIRNDYPILVPVCDRPQYLKKVLTALQKVRSIEETIIIFSQDERDADVHRLIDAFPLRKVHMKHTQPFFALFAKAQLLTRIHCTASNIFFLLNTAFRSTDVEGVIVLEDDVVPSVNFYEYFKWCFEKILLDSEFGEGVLSCGAYNICSKGNIPLKEKFALFKEDEFNSWGWAISRRQWEKIKSDWSFTSWDRNMEHRIMPKRGLVNYRPYLSHVDYIGSHGINVSRSEDCRFYRAVLDPEPIDFANTTPVLTNGLPSAYQEELKKYQIVIDPEFNCERGKKILPVIWDRLKTRLPNKTLAALRQRFPFL